MHDRGSKSDPNGWPERSTRFWTDATMPRFWPPRPSFLWGRVLDRVRPFYARRVWGVTEVAVDAPERAFKRFGPHDGVLLAPNHSHEGDAHAMLELARRVKRRFHFMVAWHAFCANNGFNGWLLQRMGCFSVDRVGTDRRSVRQATELLAGGESLVLFPEGEIHHLNDRLMPLLDGGAFIASKAQKLLAEKHPEARVWILPVALRYEFVEDVTARMEAEMKGLEARLFWWKPKPGAPLYERVIRFGEMLLTIKEKEKLGRSRENDGDLPARIGHLIDCLLAPHEQRHLGKSPSAETVSLRAKVLRRRLLELGTAEQADEETCRRALDGLDDVQLALQLCSYPGDYVAENPSPERLAETIEKFREDVYGARRPIGRRRARVILGEPIDMKRECASGRTRAVVTAVTDRLEDTIRQLLETGAPAP
jgi:hypothetical protein